MRAKHVMTYPVITATADQTVREVAQILSTRHISAVPIVGDSGKVSGIGAIEEAQADQAGRNAGNGRPYPVRDHRVTSRAQHHVERTTGILQRAVRAYCLSCTALTQL